MHTACRHRNPAVHQPLEANNELNYMRCGQKHIPPAAVCRNDVQMCQEMDALVIEHGTRNEISKLGL